MLELLVLTPSGAPAVLGPGNVAVGGMPEIGFYREVPSGSVWALSPLEVAQRDGRWQRHAAPPVDPRQETLGDVAS